MGFRTEFYIYDKLIKKCILKQLKVYDKIQIKNINYLVCSNDIDYIKREQKIYLKEI